ncbi:MAG: rhomboid family intramembrane serine protease [Bacteroidetes bacterium]|nr:MAG: rhomboid family intramembrane serine protease [Bacteroidota bacterium]
MSDFRYVRPSNFPPVVKNLIIINVLVFVGQLTITHLTERLMLYPIMPESLHQLLVEKNWIDEYQKFQPYQIFTHLFSHSPTMFAHILFNMFALWMFGRILENVWGPKRFLIFYLASGVGAAALHLTMQYFRCEALMQDIIAGSPAVTPERIMGASAPALGASGAIMGLFAAFAYLFPNTELFFLFIPFPIKAKWMVLVMVGLDLFGGFSNVSGDNVAHFAHLGGAITGFIIVFIWNKTNRRSLY